MYVYLYRFFLRFAAIVQATYCSKVMPHARARRLKPSAVISIMRLSSALVGSTFEPGTRRFRRIINTVNCQPGIQKQSLSNAE